MKLSYCLKCDRPIAEILHRLGSLFCHDCRRPGNVKHGGFNG